MRCNLGRCPRVRGRGGKVKAAGAKRQRTKHYNKKGKRPRSRSASLSSPPAAKKVKRKPPK